eukprot:153047-Chlamydomonas_euryale.AAC.19
MRSSSAVRIARIDHLAASMSGLAGAPPSGCISAAVPSLAASPSAWNETRLRTDERRGDMPPLGSLSAEPRRGGADGDARSLPSPSPVAALPLLSRAGSCPPFCGWPAAAAAAAAVPVAASNPARSRPSTLRCVPRAPSPSPSLPPV